jgi:hypothetical protein
MDNGNFDVPNIHGDSQFPFIPGGVISNGSNALAQFDTASQFGSTSTSTDLSALFTGIPTTMEELTSCYTDDFFASLQKDILASAGSHLPV